MIYIHYGWSGKTIIPQTIPKILIAYRDMSHRFTTQLEEDDFGDLIVTIPYEICEELGWDLEQELDYDISDDGTSFTLKKATND
tara:strand:+ start:241 stop:492 length:252 start_codon:yes stop_codon:yes gene_type:complete